MELCLVTASQHQTALKSSANSPCGHRLLQSKLKTKHTEKKVKTKGRRDQKKKKKKRKKEKVNRYLQTYQEAPAGRFVCDETVVSDAATVLGCACSCWGRCRCCYHYHHHHHRCCHMLATCWKKKKKRRLPKLYQH